MDRATHGAVRRAAVRVSIAVLVAALGLSAPARAVDGVIEINQATASFPVTLAQPGSYRLTSDLIVPGGIDGIRITADDVTLDLNGFRISGGGGAIADGISIGSQRNVNIRNGTVRGFSRHGVFSSLFSQLIRAIGVQSIGNGNTGLELQGKGGLVDGCTATGNGSGGIRVSDGSLVINSIAWGNVGLGLLMSATSGYRSNVLTENNGGNANPQATGTGLQLGSNVCGSDLVCP